MQNGKQLEAVAAKLDASEAAKTAVQIHAAKVQDRELLFEITQAFLAIAVVLGGGAALVLAPESPSSTFIGGAMGTVLGLYFQKKLNGISK